MKRLRYLCGVGLLAFVIYALVCTTTGCGGGGGGGGTSSNWDAMLWDTGTWQ